jgi:transcription elongation factor GreA-like protein
MNDINQSSLNVFYEIYEDFSIHLFFYLFCFVFKQTLSLVRVMWVAACSLEYRNVVFAMRLSRVL